MPYLDGWRLCLQTYFLETEMEVGPLVHEDLVSAKTYLLVGWAPSGFLTNYLS